MRMSLKHCEHASHVFFLSANGFFPGVLLLEVLLATHQPRTSSQFRLLSALCFISLLALTICSLVVASVLPRHSRGSTPRQQSRLPWTGPYHRPGRRVVATLCVAGERHEAVRNGGHPATAAVRLRLRAAKKVHGHGRPRMAVTLDEAAIAHLGLMSTAPGEALRRTFVATT